MPEPADKRDIAASFRERLDRLIVRSGLNQSRFATEAGIDRSAMSQLLSGETTRLPRAETLIRIAQMGHVSLDWLLGISQDEGMSASIAPALALEEVQGGHNDTILASWHGEAAGTKIRYVPATIPDLLRTRAIIRHETRETKREPDIQIDEAEARVAYTRRTETDMEVCMPYQQLDMLRDGLGIWQGVTANDRREQILHMAALTSDLYPGFRLYLFDGRSHFSAPYTVFGPIRAAVYMGDMYMVLNTNEAIASLTRHFDQLVRAASVRAHEVSGYLERLAEAIKD